MLLVLGFFRNPQPLRIHLADINDTNIYCYHFAKPVSHLKINHETPMTALRIDDETFMCNFGCPAQTKSVRMMLQHWLECHTREELAHWSLGYDWLYRMYIYGITAK